ncbi:hypothetical protein MMAD_22330 [Mycolicibacterium madagascariense]|uniref:DUF5642 domain-containing protein n=1 Tax=Mycolicibacterium madagascariense TaxID=212765 RepID=A0A7I7XFH2_9MYCO|nr:hypothetical protein [Mycolicibacterium madagascariense]MCV7013685.1 hypothetical protein [Mycolicibacterium madagascariense]BBZ27938.1 hypothetical protein MMAD_22330 [Mycolicibacterium madagascariense]
MRLFAGLIALVVLSGCTVKGTATWPGARLNAGLLTAADFPRGVQFDKIVEPPGGEGSGDGPPAMISEPAGCSDGLTRVIAASAERGPGSAAKYSVAYDGARIVMTVLTSTLDLDQLDATATRCARYETFFDRSSPAIPVTTTKLPPPRPGALTYRQTLRLQGRDSSVYLAFENVGDSAMFGMAFPTPNPDIPAKGSLPQTFLDVIAKQADRLRRG